MVRAGWFISKYWDLQRGCNVLSKSNKGRDTLNTQSGLLLLFPEIANRSVDFAHFFKSVTLLKRLGKALGHWQANTLLISTGFQSSWF